MQQWGEIRTNSDQRENLFNEFIIGKNLAVIFK